MIYLDNNATTRVAPEVFNAMRPLLEDAYGNPSSLHALGMAAKNEVIAARAYVARLIGVKPSEIVFTSSCTESNHLAILSALKNSGRRRRIVTTAVEHSSTLSLLASLDADIVYLPVLSNGMLDMVALESAVTPDTVLVSVMWANNETGALFPIAEVANIARAHGALFHTDAAQAVGRIPTDCGAIGADFVSFSGHKLHAPKGIGALYVRKGITLHPLLYGHQERNRRGGTENVPAIVGLGAACALATTALPTEYTRIVALRDRLETGLMRRVPCARVNAQTIARLPNTSNITFTGIAAEVLLTRLDRVGIAASSGSACNVGGDEPSHVLLAMGLTPVEARSTLRFSLGRFNTDADIDYVVETLSVVADQLAPPLAA